MRTFENAPLMTLVHNPTDPERPLDLCAHEPKAFIIQVTQQYISLYFSAGYRPKSPPELFLILYTYA